VARCAFSIGLRDDDRELLEEIRRALHYSGNMYDVPLEKRKRGSLARQGTAMIQVSSMHELTTYVIPFFERYPPRGQKRQSYELWKRAVGIVRRGEHRTLEGWLELTELKERINAYRP
jgi:ubiquinone/menaquinone biosynthesis C-methylase UbiE